jgi:uncharacterized membrane protein
MSKTKRALLWLLALSMIAIGVSHFTSPEPFMRIVPPPIPALGAVYLSGVFEILFGAGLLNEKTRRWAAFGLMALYIAVFPANIYMAIEGIQIDPAAPIPEWGAWLRLPFQLGLISWAWWLSKK